MKILLSIKPEYAEKILNGSKRYEYRTVMPKHFVETVVMYSTLPEGMVVGEFSVERVLIMTPADLWRKTSKKSGISADSFDEYFKGRDVAYAFEIEEAKRYEQALPLQAVCDAKRPPQSFRYLG